MIGPAGTFQAPRATNMPRTLLPGQTIVYYVLYGLEMDRAQACWIRSLLEKEGYFFTARQINGALQRLRKDGLAKYERGRWHRCGAGWIKENGNG